MIEEIWKSVPESPYLTNEQNEIYTSRYQISNHGRMWSNFHKRIIKPHPNTQGYLVKCWQIPPHLRTPQKRAIVSRVHRMVAISFIDNPENKPQVNHIDGNKLNNMVTNLEWNTMEENLRHSQYDLGYLEKYGKKGHESPYARLKKEQYEFVIKNYEPKHKEFGARAMARKFGVHHKTILKILGDAHC